MEGLDIQVHYVGMLKDIALLKTSGFIDTSTAPEFHKIINKMLEQGIVQYVVDMESVQYVSSAGWSVFVSEIRGIKERSGNLKLCHMLPGVLEVFEMLEFNRIISTYETIEEAIDEFDFCRDIHRLPVIAASGETPELQTEKMQDKKPVTRQAPATPARQTLSETERPEPTSKPRSERKETHPRADLPLNEKIKQAVLQEPGAKTITLKKRLNTEEFGFSRVNYFQLRRLLKHLGLDTQEKRFRYYRSR
ncbi:MAG: STAS domain-containing protein [candidate division KSB1 bacterium]|nr:STAS domain-containing protein [candidate division KSB1 bacterium]